jgi:Restriction endonuclease NotI
VTNKVLELFGSTTRRDHDWPRLVGEQWCPFTSTKCFKVRKSDPDVSIGTCTLRHGTARRDVIICPNRLLERRQVFTDCLHLLTQHEPGNELHVIPEVSIPGGSVDYFLVSARKGTVRDFVAIEFQTIDTTGTVWPERQRLLRELGLDVLDKDADSAKPFGMNWKMTAKTILVQLHHKVDTLEHVNKRLVLVIQDCLLTYLRRELNFEHLKDVRVGDAMHIHSYKLDAAGGEFRLQLDSRVSTDAAGVAECLGIQADTKIELETIVAELERKISAKTVLTLDAPIPPSETLPTE